MGSEFSRRQLLQRGAGAVGGIAALGALGPSAAFASGTAAPRPIPGGLRLSDFSFVPSDADFHFLLPGITFEMSTITDFAGVVGGSETRGTAHGNDGSTHVFDCDMRFMEGLYVGLDGRQHIGSFGFI
ncbi:MAG: hypothetical protein ACTHMY_20705 [Solirubrobacteraceae bacterium]